MLKDKRARNVLRTFTSTLTPLKLCHALIVVLCGGVVVSKDQDGLRPVHFGRTKKGILQRGV